MIRHQGAETCFEMAMLIPKILTVLILPINAFGSGQMHSKSGDPDENTALVQHHFKGSWKADHPFEKPQEHSDAQQGRTESSEQSSQDSQDTKSGEKQDKPEEKHEGGKT